MSVINKAYWLQVIKEHGSEGGTAHIRQVTRGQYPEVKAALDALVAGSYITMTGGRGQGGYRYQLTSFGHRYLNEHPDEAKQEPAPPVRQPVDGAVRAGVSHPVPVSPTYTSRREVEPEIGEGPTYLFMDESKAHKEDEPAAPTAKPDKRVDETIAKEPVQVGHDALLAITTVSIDQAVLDALHSLLYERFAHAVSAKDLVERIIERQS